MSLHPKMPKEGTISTTGSVGILSQEKFPSLDHSILLKWDGLPTYYLGAMVDDHLMGITHVIRHLNGCPPCRFMCTLSGAFDWQEPIFVHLSIFLKPSGKRKLSKRDTAVALKDGHSIFIGDMKNWATFRGTGIVLMGRGVPEDDVMTLDEMIADLATRIKPYFLNEGLVVDDVKLEKIIPVIHQAWSLWMTACHLQPGFSRIPSCQNPRNWLRGT